jgi:hypothetical protein
MRLAETRSGRSLLQGPLSSVIADKADMPLREAVSERRRAYLFQTNAVLQF